MPFSALGLSKELVRAITERGYLEPSPIQAQAIPAALNGQDILAGAQTGTGKTASFALPILQRLSTAAPDGARRRIRALVLTPTRELAAQVEESFRQYGKYTKLKSTAVFGGAPMRRQIQAVRGPMDILVATPGRLLDHVQQRTVDLSGVEILVLDEADRMLDMGFIRDIRRILAVLPAKRQNLLFSATFSDEMKVLAEELLTNPARIQVAKRNAVADAVTQRVYSVDQGQKRDLLVHLIKEQQWFQVLVFTRTKHGADRLAEQMTRSGVRALAIHGNKTQAVRTRALAEFKTGRLQALVATDIAARGLDIKDLPRVVNFDLPHVPEDYVHRIGRTGRAGAEGEALSLVGAEERGMLAGIERLLKRTLPREIVVGFEPKAVPSARPANAGPRRGAAPSNGRNRGTGDRNARPSRPAGGRPAGSRPEGRFADRRRDQSRASTM